MTWALLAELREAALGAARHRRADDALRHGRRARAPGPGYDLGGRAARGRRSGSRPRAAAASRSSTPWTRRSAAPTSSIRRAGRRPGDARAHPAAATGRGSELAALEAGAGRERDVTRTGSATTRLHGPHARGRRCTCTACPPTSAASSCERGEVTASVFERARLDTYREAAYKPLAPVDPGHSRPRSHASVALCAGQRHLRRAGTVCGGEGGRDARSADLRSRWNRQRPLAQAPAGGSGGLVAAAQPEVTRTEVGSLPSSTMPAPVVARRLAGDPDETP